MLNAEEKKNTKKPRKIGSVLIKARDKHSVACILTGQRTNFGNDEKISFFLIIFFIFETT